jgi:hypothetical protein
MSKPKVEFTMANSAIVRKKFPDHQLNGVYSLFQTYNQDQEVLIQSIRDTQQDSIIHANVLSNGMTRISGPAAVLDNWYRWSSNHPVTNEDKTVSSLFLTEFSKNRVPTASLARAYNTYVERNGIDRLNLRSLMKLNQVMYNRVKKMDESVWDSNIKEYCGFYLVNLGGYVELIVQTKDDVASIRQLYYLMCASHIMTALAERVSKKLSLTS